MCSCWYLALWRSVASRVALAHRAKLSVAKEDLEQKLAAAAAAKELAEAKARKAEEKEEMNRAMSEAGLSIRASL